MRIGICSVAVLCGLSLLCVLNTSPASFLQAVCEEEARSVFGSACTLVGSPKSVADKCTACGGTKDGQIYTSSTSNKNNSSSSSTITCKGTCTQTSVTGCG